MTRDSVEIFESLVKIVGPNRVKITETEKILYSHDLAPLPKEVGLAFNTMPDAVVRPKNAEEVSRIVQVAIKHDIPIVPRGAATWGFGGAIPSQGGIVVDISSMNRVIHVDQENLEIVVEAGAVWKKVYDIAMRRGLFIVSYPSSMYGATVAGWINTGGIGIGCYKYGSVGQNIRNMEVVLPDGRIIETGFNGVSDHSAGYNLNGLFVGSEGTLGIITKVTLKAEPAPEVLRPLSYQFKGLGEAFPFIKALTRNGIKPLHVGFVDERHVDYLKQMGKHTPGPGALINIALEGNRGSVKYEESVLDALNSAHGGKKLSDQVAEHEWNERAYEFRPREVGLSAALGEIVVPLHKFPIVVREIYELINDMGMEASIIGMVNDRNTVAFLPYFIFDEKKLIKGTTGLAFPKKLGDIAFRHDGRPLGLGLLFAGNLPKIRGEAAELMYDLKTVLDPHDIMNPGKSIEGVTKQGVPIPKIGMDMAMGMMAAVKMGMMDDDSFKKKAKKYKMKNKKELMDD
ncbi:MAG: FAD-binding oxidoreductase [Thermoplasmata archaeon]|nr:FAD-binding oxidoreductase [Thermoplasmata archaeon]